MDTHHLPLDLPLFLRDEALPAPDGGVEAFPPTFIPQLDWHSIAPYAAPVDDNDNAPFDYSAPPIADITTYLTPTTGLGLPVYSASGFDLLSVLAKVANRKNPQIQLGPVDLTCSFAVVDTRRFDHPIVYCSPTFCTLTGYSESEVVGKNCRFLQAPGGTVRKGERRTSTSHEAVAHLKKSLTCDKECQTSIVNYKKDGSAFINLVTVIPIPSGDNGDGPVVYQIGFQVDLTEQPNAILERLRDGSYVVNYQQQQSKALPAPGKERKSAAPVAPLVMSPELKGLLADQRFLHSIPITVPAAAPPLQPASSTEPVVHPPPNHPLHSILLEATPDFIHVVSLKGIFLYVAPSVRRVLGYEANELVGLGWADLAHKEDVVPLMRELKESSALTANPIGVDFNIGAPVGPVLPRLVDLLFRAKTKMGRYVWVECRGRLHVEPGKGRKAIILTGRSREMNYLPWTDVNLAGGVAKASGSASQEFWGFLSGFSTHTMAFLSATRGIIDVLGYTPEEALGLPVHQLVVPGEDNALSRLGEVIRRIRLYQDYRQGVPYALANELPRDASQRVHKTRCQFYTKNGVAIDIWFIVYRTDVDTPAQSSSPDSTIPCAWRLGAGIAAAHLVYQIRLVDAPTMIIADDDGLPKTCDLFDELAISRGSSWQYELQQLRFTNQRHEEQLSSLEAKLSGTNITSSPAQDPPHAVTNLPQEPISPPSSAYNNRSPSYSRDTSLYYPPPQSYHHPDSHHPASYLQASDPYQYQPLALPPPPVPFAHVHTAPSLPPPPTSGHYPSVPNAVPPMTTPNWVSVDLPRNPPLQHPRPTRHDVGPSSTLKRSWAAMDRSGRP